MRWSEDREKFVGGCMKYYRVYIAACVMLFSLIAQSAPLRFVPQKMIQPSGEIINCYASGDEYYNWLHDKDGYTIVQDQNGYYVYSEKINGVLVPTKNIVGRSNPAAAGLPKWAIHDAKDILKKIKSASVSTSQLQKNIGTTRIASAPWKGSMNNVVIFIRFSDEDEFTENADVFDSMFNNADTIANSLYNYYNEASYGQLHIKSKFFPASDNNSIRSYKDGNPRNYYNAYSITNQIGYTTGIEKTEREHTLLANAINAIRNDIPSTEDLDADQDGNVDNVCFIVKGSPEVWGSVLWPHMWTLDAQNVFLNAKKVTTYNFQLEYNLLDLGVGVLCHEMFHSIGAPDLYHYSLDGMTPVGGWDLMETTSNPPEHMSAYMKYRYGHWISSIPEISATGTYPLNPLTSPTDNCFKIASPNSSKEYFVVEYRKKQGVFERSVPSEGVVVYRINENSDGLGNANIIDDEVYVYRPGGTKNDNGEPDNASLSSNSGRIKINDYTDPASVLSNGLSGGLDVSHVGAIADNIVFSFTKTSLSKLDITSPVGNETFKTSNQTLITWINSSISDIKIDLTLDGAIWNTIATVSGQSGIINGEYLWNIPSMPTTTAKIRISDASNADAYSMSRNYFSISTVGQLYEREPNDDIASATPIASGETFEGDISPVGDADYFKFTAMAGDTIDVFARAVNSGIWGRIQVLNDSGFIAYGDGSYNGLMTNDRLSVLIPSSGAYYIRYAFRENWGPAVNGKTTAPPQETTANGKALASGIAYNTFGKYQLSLKKFKISPPDFSGAGGAWSLTQTSASLYWNVQENGCSSTYTFEYGVSNFYGNEIDQHAAAPLPTYLENMIQSPTITGLLPNTTYHFRIKAVNAFGVYYSKDAVFTTAQESELWERQLANWDGELFKFIPFNEQDGLTFTRGSVAGDGLFKTNDGGKTWSEKIKFPDDMNTNGASFITMSTGWIVGNYIYKTIDGGASWTKLANPTNKQLLSVRFTDEKNGWAVGSQGVIIHTADGGGTWKIQDPGSLSGMWESLMAVDFCDVNTGIATGTSGLLLKTTDGGSTWTKLPSGTTATLNGAHILNPLIATVLGDGPCGGAGNILRTNDGGKSWVNQNNPTGEYLYSVDYLDENNGLGVGIDGAIAKTTDGGTTWVRQESGVRSVLRDVKFISASSAIVVGDWGVLLKTVDRSSKSVVLKSPVGNEQWRTGSVQNIQWQKNNLSAVNIYLSTDNGTVWKSIAENIPASFNTFGWLVPNTPSDDCRIKITDAADNTTADWDHNSFAIKSIATEVGKEMTPKDYSLSQNFPNPFNPTTTIRYALPKRSLVTISVYDMLGRKIAEPVNDDKPAGYFDVVFDGGGLSSGMYLYKIRAGNFTDQKMFMLVK
jgi:M6 family metalloprotease-like protein